MNLLMGSGLSILSLIGMLLTFSISVFVPIITLIIYAIVNKKKGVWLAWLLGAAGFFVMQIVIRMPIVSLLSEMPKIKAWYNRGPNILIYLFILAFTAALFELVARYVVAKILKKKNCYPVAVGAGLGHGGIEAIVLIGGTYISNIICYFLIITGNFRELLYTLSDMGVDVTELRMIEYQLEGTPMIMYLLAGYERILTMIIHIALTVIVFYFVHKGKDFIGILLCMFLHFTVDFAPGFIQYLGRLLFMRAGYSSTVEWISLILVYVFLTTMAIIGLVITLIIRHKWKKESV